MRVLAIGGSGFIGLHVAARLMSAGHAVAVLHRGEAPSRVPAAIPQLRGDRDRPGDVAEAIRRVEPEAVLDMILYTERQAEGLLGALQGSTCRVVVVSSGDVYRNYDGFRGKPTAPPDWGPLAEDAPLRETRYPYRGYGLTLPWAEDYDKVLVERAVLTQGSLPVVVLRLPAVYGPGDKLFRLRPYLRRMDDRRPAILLDTVQAGWRWTRGYVGDVAAAIVCALTDPRAHGIYNVGETHAPTEHEWVETIGRAAGWQGRVRVVAAEALPAHLRQPFDWRYDLETDTERLRRELGFVEPVSKQERWERTLAWERAHPGEIDPQEYAAEDVPS